MKFHVPTTYVFVNTDYSWCCTSLSELAKISNTFLFISLYCIIAIMAQRLCLVRMCLNWWPCNVNKKEMRANSGNDRFFFFFLIWLFNSEIFSVFLTVLISSQDISSWYKASFSKNKTKQHKQKRIKKIGRTAWNQSLYLLSLFEKLEMLSTFRYRS